MLWEAQPAINKDKALPGMGLGRVIADSIISLSPPPSGPQITWALGHCPLDSAQRQREMAKQFISSETECKLGLVKRLGPESNDRALILEATEESDHEHPGVEPGARRGPSSGGVSAATPSLSGRTHTRTPSPQPHSGGCPSSQIRSQALPLGPVMGTCARRANEHPPGNCASTPRRGHPFPGWSQGGRTGLWRF